MKTTFVHLSDLHYSPGRDEDQGVVLDTLFEDIGKQLRTLEAKSPFLVLSGDIAQGADSPGLYDSLIRDIDARLNDLDIPKSRRVCVPGNHDIARSSIEAKREDHEGIVSQKLSEQKFNDYVSNRPNVLTEKFAPYWAFESQFGDFGIGGSSATGAGWEIGREIGLYCLNTALSSTAGLLSPDGKPIVDKGRLAVDTRRLHSWLQRCDAQWKVLVMHHPASWLCDWAEREVRTLLSKHFVLCLTGHTHDQSSFHSFSNGTSLVECSAPPLFTSKSADLGYSIVSLHRQLGVAEITYRQWTKHQTFRPGVNFSNTEDGKVTIVETRVSGGPDKSRHAIDDLLTSRLDQALASFSSQPRVWVPPVVSTESEVTRDAESKPKVELANLVAAPRSAVVKAPPLFGLTCLAHYLVREAWRSPQPAVWLCLDSQALKPHAASIDAAVAAELALFDADVPDVKCVVLDSWTNQDKDSYKVLRKVCERFEDVPVICMETNDEARFFLLQPTKEPLNREFEVLYLWSLPRSHVRKLVADYNEARPIGDEDVVTAKVVSDLEVMNIHRTALNCLTLLKVSEMDFDESPVNRTELIKRVLFLLFNIDEIPTYKNRPDLKDCEYVLGYFCERLLREEASTFSRERFLEVLQECCTERLIDLETSVVFDVLYANNILVRRGSAFCFRFSFWVFYFAAQRMHHDPTFAQFIYEDMRYARYPEIGEFYTGIDRRREDALQVLTKDVRATCDAVQAKTGLPVDLNVFGLAQWKSSPETLAQMQSEISNGVKSSNLPTVIKDQYADRRYDRTRPYDQEIRSILSEYSFAYMLQVMKAGARALRNSDYASPEAKRQLLHEILRCWEQLSLVMLIVSPVLAEEGRARFNGAGFLLVGSFGETLQERIRNILVGIPTNVVTHSQEDLFSQKMAPLLIEHMHIEKNDLRRHELLLLLIRQRPRGWKAEVQRYIASIGKNSFFLLDVYGALRAQYRYSYASSQGLREIEYLIKMAAAKHVTGAKEPGVKLIGKVKDEVIPPREV